MRGPVPGLFIGVLRVPSLGSLRHNFMKTFALFTARSQRQIGLQNCFLEVFPYVSFPQYTNSELTPPILITDGPQKLEHKVDHKYFTV